MVAAVGVGTGLLFLPASLSSPEKPGGDPDLCKVLPCAGAELGKGPGERWGIEPSEGLLCR